MIWSNIFWRNQQRFAFVVDTLKHCQSCVVHLVSAIFNSISLFDGCFRLHFLASCKPSLRVRNSAAALEVHCLFMKPSNPVPFYSLWGVRIPDPSSHGSLPVFFLLVCHGTVCVQPKLFVWWRKPSNQSAKGWSFHCAWTCYMRDSHTVTLGMRQRRFLSLPGSTLFIGVASTTTLREREMHWTSYTGGTLGEDHQALAISTV